MLFASTRIASIFYSHWVSIFDMVIVTVRFYMVQGTTKYFLICLKLMYIRSNILKIWTIMRFKKYAAKNLFLFEHINNTNVTHIIEHKF